MGNNAAWITPVDDYVDVAIHASDQAFGTSPDGLRLGAVPVADMIRQNPKFDGGPIRLIACRAGASDCGPASALATELGVEVMAPSTTVWVYPDGRLRLGEGVFDGVSLQISEPGEWVRFYPEEGER
jgi:hypothetical protein